MADTNANTNTTDVPNIVDKMSKLLKICGIILRYRKEYLISELTISRKEPVSKGYRLFNKKFNDGTDARPSIKSSPELILKTMKLFETTFQEDSSIILDEENYESWLIQNPEAEVSLPGSKLSIHIGKLYSIANELKNYINNDDLLDSKIKKTCNDLPDLIMYRMYQIFFLIESLSETQKEKIDNIIETIADDLNINRTKNGEFGGALGEAMSRFGGIDEIINFATNIARQMPTPDGAKRRNLPDNAQISKIVKDTIGNKETQSKLQRVAEQTKNADVNSMDGATSAISDILGSILPTIAGNIEKSKPTTAATATTTTATDTATTTTPTTTTTATSDTTTADTDTTTATSDTATATSEAVTPSTTTTTDIDSTPTPPLSATTTQEIDTSNVPESITYMESDSDDIVV